MKEAARVIGTMASDLKATILNRASGMEYRAISRVFLMH